MNHKILSFLNSVHPFAVAHAHCDIPCGIYDPYQAQVNAHTVIRMMMLIHDLPNITTDMGAEEKQEVMHKLARYTAVKEEHAEAAKREVRILWGDYFKPEHAEQFPELNQLVWDTLKAGSKARQEIDIAAGDALLENVQKIAEIFWQTKGAETVRQKSFYPTEREMVYPKA